MGDSGRDKRRWRRDVCGYEHTFWVNKIIMKCVNVFLSFPVLYAGVLWQQEITEAEAPPPSENDSDQQQEGIAIVGLWASSVRPFCA